MSETLDPVTRHHLHQAAEALKEEFSWIFSAETIERYIAESRRCARQLPDHGFVPVLAHRFARERLMALAQAQDLVPTDQPEVLFVCVHNAGRSQMAAGLAEAPLGGPDPRPLGRQRARARRSTRPWSRR